ncbi:MAG: hypothetical protein JXQ67_04055 [Campylobacterales bacterium]|nr:hypothetical protein [Campylobacterales bacterium]
MKFTKLSLVAALVIGSSAFAIENTKVSGDAKLYYHTSDADGATSALGSNNDGSLFNAEDSAADVAVNLNATTDLVKTDSVSISAGAGLTVLTTLGLENTLVGNVWGGAHTAAANGSSIGAKVQNAWWVNEAWMAATAGQTTLKLGRMELDTPLAFTEKWSIEQNTFEAAVVMNQDIPDTTLVGAFIGNGNGNEGFGINTAPASSGVQMAGVVNGDGQFQTFGSNGAFAIGAINNSFKPLTLQAWYYDVSRVVEAYWLQADLACEKIPGLMVGAQYSGHTLSKNANIGGATPLAAGDDLSSDVYAVMLGFKMEDTFTVKAAYSQVGKDFAAGFNTATGYTRAQSKLYTEAWWGGNFGKVTQADTQSFKVCASTPANGIANLTASYTSADQSETAGNNDMSEIAVTASKTFGPLDATLAYIYTDAENHNVNVDNTSNAIQAYLTLNF